MKNLYYLLFLALGMTSCSVESIDSTEDFLTADVKLKNQEVQDPMKFYAGNSGNLKGSFSIWNDCDNLYVEILPAGDAPDDAVLGLFSELPAINDGGNLVNELEYSLEDASNLKWTISLSDLNPDQDLFVFIKAWGDWAGPVSLGKVEYSIFQFDLSACACEESFNYNLNEDGSYTFTFIPEEDMAGAEVEFTFAQSVVASGYNWPSWNGKSSSRTEVMDLNACSVYTWNVLLTGDCSGNSPESNLWTDFKVNDISKKGELANIERKCS